MDAALRLVGDWGRYQMQTFSLLCLQFLAAGSLVYAFIYSVVEPKHRCQLSADDSHYEHISSNDSRPLADVVHENYSGYGQCVFMQNDTVLTECLSHVYDQSEVRRSLVSQFNLVCSKRYAAAAIATAGLFGRCVGSVISGTLADKYGRKSTLLLMVTLQFCSAACSVIPNPYSYMALSLVTTSCASGAYECAYVIAMEMVSPSKRVVLSAAAAAFFTVGYFTDTAVMYMLRDWQYLSVFAAALVAPLPLIFARFVPESPRWLVTVGRCSAAKTILLDIAARNKKQVSYDELLLSEDDHDTGSHSRNKPNLKAILASSALRGRIALFFFIWFTVNLTYYGLPLQSSYLSGGMYLNHVLNGAADLPVFVMLYVSAYIGRKKTLIICLTCGAVGTLLTGLMQYFRFFNGFEHISLLGTFMGKFGSAAAYNELYIWTVENMPTLYRNMVLGLCSSVSGIGATVAPFIVQIDSNRNQFIPSLIFGSALMLSCIAAILIPETNKKALPDTIPEAEALGKTARDEYVPLL